MDMKAIFIPTIQHTGTWFCIEFLKAHNEVQHFVELKDLRVNGSEMTLIHTHFGDGNTHHPADVSKHIPFYVVNDLINEYPSITTVRDPLAALITRQIRCPDLWHTYIIDSFVSLAKEIKKMPNKNLFLLPVDLYKTKSFEMRYQILNELLSHVGLSEDPYAKFWAAGWPIYNTVGDSSIIGLKEYYNLGEVDKIEAAFPEEYAHLKRKEPILRPFLEKLGYRDLIWWNKKETSKSKPQIEEANEGSNTDRIK
jgi:hypothetical protein